MIRCCFGDIFKKGKNPKFLILENIFPLRVAILEKIKNDDSWSAMPCEPNNHVLHPITRPHQSRDFPGRRFSSLKLCWKNDSSWGPLQAGPEVGLKWVRYFLIRIEYPRDGQWPAISACVDDDELSERRCLGSIAEDCFGSDLGNIRVWMHPPIKLSVTWVILCMSEFLRCLGFPTRDDSISIDTSCGFWDATSCQFSVPRSAWESKGIIINHPARAGSRKNVPVLVRGVRRMMWATKNFRSLQVSPALSSHCPTLFYGNAPKTEWSWWFLLAENDWVVMLLRHSSLFLVMC